MFLEFAIFSTLLSFSTLIYPHLHDSYIQSIYLKYREDNNNGDQREKALEHDSIDRVARPLRSSGMVRLPSTFSSPF
jgi:hypothetical protein